MQRIKGIKMDEELYLRIKKYMRMESGIYAYSLINALRKFSVSPEPNYYMGLYFLEYGRIYRWVHGRYYEGKVSFRRARRYLRTAYRYQPQNAEIIFALGESYYRDAKVTKPASHYRKEKLEKALDFYRRAFTLDVKNGKFIWCVMEVEYLLGMFNQIEALFNSYAWEELADQEIAFWAKILLMYLIARQGDSKRLKEMLRAISIPNEIEDMDVAAICIVQLFAMADDYEEMKRVYTQYKRYLSYIASPCKDYFTDNVSPSFPDKGIKQAIISWFSPVGLVSHDKW